MPMSEWWIFNANMVASDRDEPGVYEFADAYQGVIYIGSSNHLRTRLGQHLAGSDACVLANARYYRLDYRLDCRAEERARLLAHLIAPRHPSSLQRPGALIPTASGERDAAEAAGLFPNHRARNRPILAWFLPAR